MGPSGSGKTTLIDIILGLVPPSCGSVKYGSVSIHENMSNLLHHQQNIAYSQQKYFALIQPLPLILFSTKSSTIINALECASVACLLSDRTSRDEVQITKLARMEKT